MRTDTGNLGSWTFIATSNKSQLKKHKSLLLAISHTNGTSFRSHGAPNTNTRVGHSERWDVRVRSGRRPSAVPTAVLAGGGPAEAMTGNSVTAPRPCTCYATAQGVQERAGPQGSPGRHLPPGASAVCGAGQGGGWHVCGALPGVCSVYQVLLGASQARRVALAQQALSTAAQGPSSPSLTESSGAWQWSTRVAPPPWVPC